MNADEFDKLAVKIWRDLQMLIPPDMRALVDRVQILIEDEPPAAVLEELKGSELSEHPEELGGLHIGVPLPMDSITNPDPYPTRVYLFREALLDFADFDETPEGLERLKEEIAITLLHEIGHYFGLEEDDLERLGFD